MKLLFADDFDEPALDLGVWLPHYLPAWGSRAATAATYEISDSCLRLFIPPEQGLWYPDEHLPPMRVSGIQSGNFSGPVGGTIGQQPWREGLVVKEEQPTFWGYTPQYGYLEMRARGTVSRRSMVAWWMSGLDDAPEHCGELCVTEMFGDTVVPGESAAVGVGIKAFRDPALTQDFAAVRLPIDITGFHTYAVDWTPEKADFLGGRSTCAELRAASPVPPPNDDRGLRLSRTVQWGRRGRRPRVRGGLPARLRALRNWRSWCAPRPHFGATLRP